MISKIISNRKVSPTCWEMNLSCPEIAREAKPGQFVMVRIKNDMDAFLRRPFSIHDIKEPSSFYLLYKVVGKRTEAMAGLKKGDNLDILGPLGNGFTINSDLELAVLVSGGIGAAPMLFLLRTLVKGRQSPENLNKKNIYFLTGAKTRAEILCINLAKSLGAQIFITTEDGSLGKKGMINQELEKLLEKTLKDKLDKIEKNKVSIFASGPNPLLREVSSIGEAFDVPCQISLEANMACGFGVCLGCAVKAKAGHIGFKYKKVCADGPVFDSQGIIW